MSENNKLQKRVPNALKEKGQYALALVVIASMLVVTNIPVFVIFFFGIFAYFVIRMFSTGPRNETREIFEFYLSANEILRTDDRRWYGFEIQETIHRGEDIMRRMSAVPPLVRFSLGALYNKIGAFCRSSAIGCSSPDPSAACSFETNGSPVANAVRLASSRDFARIFRARSRDLTAAEVRGASPGSRSILRRILT